jgi:hypothetical protein
MSLPNQDTGARSIARRVAVIAVHGVGNQPPFASARAIGDLLQNQNIEDAAIPRELAVPGGFPGPEDPQYEPFLERTLRINVRPVVIKKRDDWPDGMRGRFHEWVTKERRDNQSKPVRGQVDSDQYDDEIATQFMRGQLSGYKGDEPEDTYETIRLEGIRHGGTDGPEIVHIYELYWADLSNLKKNLFKIVAELYQILLHLPSLGTHVVDAEAAHHGDSAWTRFRQTHSQAVFFLSVVIPLINLFMLGNALAIAGYLALARQSEGYHVAVSLAVLALAVTAYLGKRLWTAAEGISLWIWGLPVALFVTSLLGIWSSAHACGGVTFLNGSPVCVQYARVGRGLALAELVGIATFLVSLVVRGYERMRPGFAAWAKWMSIRLAFITVATLLVSYSGAWWKSGLWEKDYSGFDGSLWLFRSFEVLEIVSLVTWGVLMALTAGAWVMGAVAVRHVNPAIDRDRPARSQWTARLTLSVSMYAFATVTLVVWALIFKGLALLVPSNTRYVPLLSFANGDTAANLTDFMRNVVNYGGIPALLILLPAGLLAALPAIWGLAPVVWAEVRPPDFEASQTEYSERLGRWLTLAFRLLRQSGRLLYLTTTVLMPIVIGVIVVTAIFGSGHREPSMFAKLLQYLTAVSGLLIASIFMTRGQLVKAVLGFRTPLDVMLDVDNWLREHPVDSNPKARISGRYVSLLRYICDWRDPLKRDAKYDAVVIVAHSQGTVITADLLRFLDRESGRDMESYDTPLVPLKRDMHLTLFTMGCPLRDLYGLRFPRLYSWTRDSGNPVMKELPSDLERDPQRVPAPLDLYAVKRWVNAYRSGDYIGRFLWRTDECNYRWDPNPEKTSTDGAVRREFCIGAGAHTHYWDHTAVETIARELNSLLDHPVGPPPAPPPPRPQDVVTA